MQNFNSSTPSFNQVLTNVGWCELKKYNQKSPVLVFDSKMNHKYLCPRIYSTHYYDGAVINLDTDHSTIALKPSSLILSNGELKKVKEVIRGDKLNRFYLSQTVEFAEPYQWDGYMCSLFFGENLYLPVKMNNDYILLGV